MNSGRFDIMLMGPKQWTKLKVKTDLTYSNDFERGIKYHLANTELKERRQLQPDRDFRIRETVNDFKQHS